MLFELLPTIDIMLALYQKPRSMERFKEYIQLLQGGTKGDLAFPITGFNPMAKEHVVQKLTELKEIGAEKIIEQTLKEISTKFPSPGNPAVFKVALNLMDDLKGGWTNRYTSDYDSKFKLNALIKRHFCTPIFWTSEKYTQELITERVTEYLLRTIYWFTASKPQTLKDHIEQEKFVAKHKNKSNPGNEPAIDFTTVDTFYSEHKDSDNYHIIFNFLYGDEASRSLEFPHYGIPGQMTGYKYADALATRQSIKNSK
jgi:hypothetical protein